MSRIAITGATGMIGRAVLDAMRARGDQVVALSRDAARARVALGRGVEVEAWPDPTSQPPPATALAGADAVVHLLGEPVAQRWTASAKQAIRDSRVLSTRLLVSGIKRLHDHERPKVLISQSATGFYGPRGEEPLTEEADGGTDFLATVVKEWEQEAFAAEPLLRVAATRTGVVLSPRGGALARMLPIFRLGIGGPVAGGRQYVPWVHLADVAGAILFCIENADAHGPLNVTAPNPVSNAEFSRTLGAVLHRPALLPVPGVALRVLYGEMAEIVTTGQRVLPERLLALGYEFRYPTLEPALRDVILKG